MVHKIRRYLLEELWNFPLRKEKGARRFLFKSLRISVLAVREFFQDQCMLHASSLTYYTIMATVPILALSFAIARGFGFHDYLHERILLYFEQNRDILLQILSFVDNMIEQARGGIIAGIGIVVLFWSITQLLSNLEQSMNQIWKVKKLRSWRRIFTDYFALMLIAPCLFLLSTSASVFFVRKVAEGVALLHLNLFFSQLLLFIAKLVPYCLFWFLFAFVYVFMPNRRVPISSAFLGGIVGGTIYLIVQWAYLYFQAGFNRIGAIYGSFAAFPLFLIWVQINWSLLLFGAEFSYAHQTLDQHEYEEKAKRASIGYRRLLSLWILHLAVSRFLNGEGPLTRDCIAVRYQIPYALATPILEDLTGSGLLLETPGGYLPAKGGLRISDALFALEEKGDSDFPFIDSSALAPLERALESFRHEIEASPDNKPLHEIY